MALKLNTPKVISNIGKIKTEIKTKKKISFFIKNLQISNYKVIITYYTKKVSQINIKKYQ